MIVTRSWRCWNAVSRNWRKFAIRAFWPCSIRWKRVAIALHSSRNQFWRVCRMSWAITRTCRSWASPIGLRRCMKSKSNTDWFSWWRDCSSCMATWRWFIVTYAPNRWLWTSRADGNCSGSTIVVCWMWTRTQVKWRARSKHRTFHKIEIACCSRCWTMRRQNGSSIPSSFVRAISGRWVSDEDMERGRLRLLTVALICRCTDLHDPFAESEADEAVWLQCGKIQGFCVWRQIGNIPKSDLHLIGHHR